MNIAIAVLSAPAAMALRYGPRGKRHTCSPRPGNWRKRILSSLLAAVADGALGEVGSGVGWQEMAEGGLH